PPADAAYLRLELVVRGGASRVNWDGIQMEPWFGLRKADGSPASDISVAYDWANIIEPDVFWPMVPEARLAADPESIWSSELIRRHFFGLDGYYYMNWSLPYNLQYSEDRRPHKEETVGVIGQPSDPSSVIAGDLPYHMVVYKHGPNNEYYA